MTGARTAFVSAAGRQWSRAWRAIGRAGRGRLLPLAAVITAVPLAAGMTLPAAALPQAVAAVHAPVPPAEKPVPVTVVHGHKAKIPVMTPWHRPATVWPAVGSATASLPAVPGGASVAAAAGVNVRAGTKLAAGNAALATVRSGEGRAGNLPVWAGRVPGGVTSGTVSKVNVTMVSRQAASAAGIQGVLFTVARDDRGTTAGKVRVNLDYAGFADAFGGDYAARLHLVELPSCVLTTPQVAACRKQTPLASADDVKADSLGADITVPGQKAAPLVATAAGLRPAASAAVPAPSATVVAAASSPSGSAGSFAATSLSEAGSWTAGGNDGSFGYSYPVQVPDVPGGLEPSVSLGYDSQSVDGLTSSTNDQASWVGDGWDYDPGYVEENYASCETKPPVPSGQASDWAKSGDLCLSSNDTVTLDLSGVNTTLVQDSDGGWHPEEDNNERVQYLTGASNGSSGGGYWEITEPDGTSYYFGLNHLPGYATGDTATDSVPLVPVYEYNSGDACYNSTAADAHCLLAWRWNLDYVTDTRGDAIAYFYSHENNDYAEDGATTAIGAYQRGDILDKIEYGLRAGDVYGSAAGTLVTPAAEVSFTTDTNRTDIPSDLACSSGATCGVVSPTFWTKTELDTITTEALDGSALKETDSWSLAHSYPATGDSTSQPSLWLDSITRTGEDGTAASLPPVTFAGTPMANRIESQAEVNDGYSEITRLRLTSITNETGGVTTVGYLAPSGGCTSGSLPAPDADTLLCYPDYWTPSGDSSPVEDWFNKYVVEEVTQQDTTANEPPVVTTYSYGGAAWHYDDDSLTLSAQRTWDQWRGFRTVTTETGPASTPDTKAVDTYFQGMNGDYLASGSASPVSLTSSQGDTVTDDDQFAGMDFEHVVDDGPSGSVVTDAITLPWTSAATGSQAQPSPLPSLVSYHTGTAETDTYTALASGGDRESTVTYTHGEYGRVTQVSSVPDTTDASEDTCTTTSYADNTSAWIMNLSSEVTVVSVPCGTTPALPADAVSDDLTFYDGATSLSSDTPTTGNVTQTQEATSYSGSTPVYTTESTSAYDEYGRVTASTNADSDTTTTAYTPATGAEPTSVSVTDPMGLVTTTAYDPLRELPLTVTNPAGWVTTEEYDALGRLTAAWTPGHTTTGNPEYKYSYDVSDTAPSVVTSESIEPDGTGYLPSETIYDSLGRAVETQSENGNGNTVVSDTYYNTDGWTVKTSSPYYISGAPTTTLVQAPDDKVPSQTVDVYDGAGRVTAVQSFSLAKETWETDTAYGGDYTTTTYQNFESGEPDGGTPETVFTNGEGQASEIYQYHSEADAAIGPTAPSSDYDATSYAYNPSGKLEGITDAAGNTWDYQYNLAGYQTSQSDPDAGTTASTYDPAGLLTSVTDADGDQVSYTYDGDGRKLAEYNTTKNAAESSSTELASWVYDTLAKGELTSSTSYYDGSAYTEQVLGYDGYGESEGTETVIPSAQGALAGTYYHAIKTVNPYDGLPQTYEDDDTASDGLAEEIVGYSYDNAGDPTSVTGAWAYDGSLSYTDLGQPSEYTLGSSSEPAWIVDSYDEQTNALTGQETQTGTTPVTVDDQHYAYDNTGQVTSEDDTPANAAAQDQCFAYDYLGRLTQAWSQGSASCSPGPSQSAEAGAAAPYWEQYGYNDENDMTAQTSTPASGAATTTSYTYASAGSAWPHAPSSQTVATGSASTTTNYVYSPDGDLDTASVSGTQTESAAWDDEGRLSQLTDSAGSTSYIYDADGNLLIEKGPSSTTLFLSDEEITLTGSALSGTRYYSIGGQAIAARTTSGGVYYLTGDQDGTQTAAISATTLAVTSRFYDPYGNPVGTPASSWPGEQGFQDGTADTATGLTNLGAREYDPGTATFISPDPLLEPTDPQDLNPYAYAADALPSSEDPSGQIAVGPPGSSCSTGTEYATQCGGNGNASPSGSGSSSSGQGGPGRAASGNNDGTRTDSRNSATSQDPGQYVLPVPYRAQYVAWLNGGGFHDANPYAAGATIELDSLAVFCDTVSASRCGGGSLTDALINDHSGIAAQTMAALGFGAFGALGREEEAGGAGAPDLADLENITAGSDLADLGCGDSFAAATQVLLADGKTVPISSLKPGEKVLATNTKTGKTRPETVTAVEVKYDTDLYDLTVKTPAGTEVIDTTSNHLFWDPYLHQGWIPAKHLKPGMHLKTPDGQSAVVVGGSVPAVHDGWMWDLTVPGNNDHDFYVVAGTSIQDGSHDAYHVVTGGTPILVHNDDCVSALASNIDPDNLTMTKTVENHFNDITKQGSPARPYMNSTQVVRGIMEGSEPTLDPRGAEGALRWDTPGALNGKEGTWELVIDANTNTILHFNFVR